MIDGVIYGVKPSPIHGSNESTIRSMNLGYSIKKGAALVMMMD